MKLPPRNFRIWWDVHAWAGAVSAVVLCAVFLLGAFALFRDEIDIWANSTGAARPLDASTLHPLFEQLVHEEGGLFAERVALIRESTGLRAYVQRDGAHQDFWLGSSGRFEPAASRIGSFLYEMHFLWPIPGGGYVAGLASLGLGLALITGVLIHLKDTARAWLRFRPARALRTWASDAHTLLGLLGLPYQLLYAWTGAVLCLSWPLVEPTFATAAFGGEASALAGARGQTVGELTALGSCDASAQLPRLDVCVQRAAAAVPGFRPTWIGVENVGRENSRVSLEGENASTLFRNDQVVLRACDCALVRALPAAEASGARRFEAWFYALHYATFGGYPVKLLYALLALATVAVLVTGNVVWLERRDPRRERRPHRLLQQLTVGCSAGLMMATAALFLANRLLPLAAAQRGERELWCFWGAWQVSLALACCVRSARRASALLLAASAICFAAAGSLGFSRFGITADATTRSVNVSLILLGLLCGVVAWALLQARSGAPRAARPPNPTPEEAA